MDTQNRIKWIAILTGAMLAFAGIAVLLFYLLVPDLFHAVVLGLRNNSGHAMVAGIIGSVAAIIVIELLFRFFIIPLYQIVEETALIGGVNSRHRIKISGGLIFGPLAKAINGIAARYEAIQQYGTEKIKSIRAVAEKERNMLAAIMAELPEGVIVCNTNGSILLYNQQARQLLSSSMEGGPQADTNPQALIGLWRSIYDIIDRNQLQHALDEIDAKFKNKDKSVAAYFMITGTAGELLRVEAVPVLDHHETYAGFILIFHDVTRHLKASGAMEGTLLSLSRQIRASSAGIRATIEAILDYPEMDRAQLDQFRRVILKEAITLGDTIGSIDAGSCVVKETEWPLSSVRISALSRMIQKNMLKKLGVHLTIDQLPDAHMVKVDTYTLTLAITFMLLQVQKVNGADVFTCRVEKDDNFFHFDFSWPGSPIKIDILKGWEDAQLHVFEERVPFTLKEILRHHSAEIGCFLRPDTANESCLRLFLPAAQTTALEPVRRVTILSQSRPEFFDFDLFGQAEPSPEVAHRLLSELTYTVFDTETTGLNPSGGDEIVSIGAVRIVNGRLLQDESFEQLIDPHRSIPTASIRIHGISPEMIKDRPPIDKVLPLFHRYAVNTILVGHNVAFDMRLLQLKEATSKIKFTNPVLDTLLLSSVIHPAQNDHTIEAIAERLGISIVGRHTAMGDAVATGNIFLKMLPLLAETGIMTLEDAVSASKKTVYARIKY